MRRQRRDPKLQAQYMIEAWGEDNARRLCGEAITKSATTSRGTYRTNQVTHYWRDVLKQFPKLPPPPPPPEPTPRERAERWAESNGVSYTLVEGLLLIPVNQVRFGYVAPSFNGRTDGSQPSD